MTRCPGATYMCVHQLVSRIYAPARTAGITYSALQTAGAEIIKVHTSINIIKATKNNTSVALTTDLATGAVGAHHA